MDKHDHSELPDTIDGSAEETWCITIDRNRCLSSGICVSTAPDYFRLQLNIPTPIQSPVPPDEQVLEVAGFCPAEAIRVHTTIDNLPLAPSSDGL